MSAGLPLLIVSILAAIIIAFWLSYGAGNKTKRVKVSSVVLITLLTSWAALLSFGVFHPIGSLGMALGFITSIVAFFIPMVYNKFQSNENT